MSNKKLIPDKEIDGIQFYKYPFLEIAIATLPTESLHEIENKLTGLIKNKEDAENWLLLILNRGRKIGIRTILYVEMPQKLHRMKRVAGVMESLERNGNIYMTPETHMKYSKERFEELIGHQAGE